MHHTDELAEYLSRVTGAMMELTSAEVEELYPVGLVNIELWEWPQGVGLYGLFNYWKLTGDAATLRFLRDWYRKRGEEPAPERNVNTTSPMLTMILLYEALGEEAYRKPCADWADWVANGLIRTGDGAFQHMITGDENHGQILIDTLFMAVLFLAKAGSVLKRPEYIEEAKHQCLIHIKYLYDTGCNLFYHGYDFVGRHNYGAVHWARGNSWYTCGLVDLLDMTEMEPGIRSYFLNTFQAQVRALRDCQHESGMWHTVLDDPDSYLEASATAAIAYGILKGVRLGYLPREYADCGQKALGAVIGCIGEDGLVGRVSYGTPVGMDRQFYKDIPVCPMTYGQAMTILLLAEAMRHCR